MRLIRYLVSVAAVSAIATSVVADDFDGSKPLICAVVEAHDCVAGMECFSGTPDVTGAPRFLRLDFERNEIVGPQRTTPIRLSERSDGQLLLQGTELDYGWALALERVTGRFSASLTNRDGVFVLLGSCLVP